MPPKERRRKNERSPKQYKDTEPNNNSKVVES